MSVNCYHSREYLLRSFLPDWLSSRTLSGHLPLVRWVTQSAGIFPNLWLLVLVANTYYCCILNVYCRCISTFLLLLLFLKFFRNYYIRVHKLSAWIWKLGAVSETDESIVNTVNIKVLRKKFLSEKIEIYWNRAF